MLRIALTRIAFAAALAGILSSVAAAQMLYPRTTIFRAFVLGMPLQVRGLMASRFGPAIAPLLNLNPDASRDIRARALMEKPQRPKYRLIDMGTFGGPSSQGTNVSPAGPIIATGWSATYVREGPHDNRIICGGPDDAINYISHTFEWRHGTIRDLGSLDGFTSCSIPFWINSLGVIAGASENGKFDPQTGTNQSRPVLWNNGEIRDLGTFGGNQGLALSVNDFGQAAGAATNAIPDAYSWLDMFILLRHRGTQTRAFFWEKGKMTDLGTLGGFDAYGEFVNRVGHVSGYSYTNNTPNPVTGVPTTDPFLWKNGKIFDLGTLGGNLGMANAMNDRDWVVGQSDLAGDIYYHPFVWNGSTMIDIGTAGGNYGEAWAVNNAGDVVGRSTLPGDKCVIAFVWKNGVRTDLPPLPGDSSSEAWGIDSRGTIVGDSGTGFSGNCGFPGFYPHAVVLWEHGKVIDVSALIPKGSSLIPRLVGHLSQAGPLVINDRGEIAGIGTPPGMNPAQVYNKGRAFLLIPIESGVTP